MCKQRPFPLGDRGSPKEGMLHVSYGPCGESVWLKRSDHARFPMHSVRTGLSHFDFGRGLLGKVLLLWVSDLLGAGIEVRSRLGVARPGAERL